MSLPRHLLAIFLLSAFLPLRGQSPSSKELTEFNRTQLARTRTGMLVLGGWSAANVAVGAIGMGQTQGEQRAFHQMNLAWGVINLGFASLSYFNAKKTDPASLDFYQTVRDHHRIQKIFLFNAGIDVGYVISGLWLRERAKTSTRAPEQLRGFGNAVIMQGGFLLLFDVGNFIYHRRLERRLKPLFPNATLGFQPHGVGMSIGLK